MDECILYIRKEESRAERKNPVKTVSLDVHAEASQLVAVSAEGEILLEMKVPTEAEGLRQVISGIPGPKRVVFEEGPLSGMLCDALKGLAEEIISCDPTQNALIARAEDSNDPRDARRLATLSRMDAIRPVYVPQEPYRSLRSVLVHDRRLQAWITSVKNRIKGLCRRAGIGYRGVAVYGRPGRADVLAEMPSAGLRWQMQSLYRQLDLLRRERVGAHRVLDRMTKKTSVVGLLQTIPGVGPITARTLVGWIVAPDRFRSRNAVNAYAGLGLGQGWTNWQPVGRARASKRGNREVKRVLFLAAEAATKSDSALARRYAAHLEGGWDASKAKRDLARRLLWMACAMWRTGKTYDDTRVAVPGC